VIEVKPPKTPATDGAAATPEEGTAGTKKATDRDRQQGSQR
jgi:hypothetical protein